MTGLTDLERAVLLVALVFAGSCWWAFWFVDHVAAWLERYRERRQRALCVVGLAAAPIFTLGIAKLPLTWTQVRAGGVWILWALLVGVLAAASLANRVRARVAR